jgi:uncharacterized protein YegP (UPF0339 family)
MRKLCGLLVLTSVLGVLASGGPGPAEAQDKTKKVKEKDRKGAKEPAPGTIEIYKDKGGDYRYRIKDAGGRVIAVPARGRETRDGVLEELEAIKVTLEKAKPVDGKN